MATSRSSRNGVGQARRRNGRRVRRAVLVSAAVPLAWYGLEAPAAGVTEDRGGSHDRITFVEVASDFTDFNIADMRIDGSGRRLLTSSPSFDIAPDYSPNGRKIAFTSGRSAPVGSEGGAAYSEIYVMNADGSNVRRITNNVGLSDSSPSWSPNGRSLVIGRGTGDGPHDLWVIDLATGVERQLTDSPDTEEGSPDWSADGRRIVFHGDLAEPGNFDVYSIRPDGTGLRRLTRNVAFDGDAHLSRDGDWIVFGSDRNANADVYLMRSDGNGVRRVTRDPSFDAQPVFSPGGRSIAFIREVDGVNDVFTMRVDGTRLRNLTNTPELNEFEPDWQP